VKPIGHGTQSAPPLALLEPLPLNIQFPFCVKTETWSMFGGALPTFIDDKKQYP
jgi:hypothetical protein